MYCNCICKPLELERIPEVVTDPERKEPEPDLAFLMDSIGSVYDFINQTGC